MMKAIVQDEYGSPDDVLKLREIDKPVAGDDEVRVRVRAAYMDVDVWHVVTGRPYVATHGEWTAQTEEAYSGNGPGGAG